MAEEHQWVVLAVYELSTEDIARQPITHERVGLTGEKLLSVEGPGCFRCGEPWQKVKAAPCPGGERLERDEGMVTKVVDGGTNVDKGRHRHG